MRKTTSSGVIGMLYAAKEPDDPKQPLFGIKVRTLKQNDIKLEQKIWEKISKFSLKPSSIPNFYGSFKEDSFFKKEKIFTVHMVYDPFSKSLKTLIEENIQKEPIPVENIQSYFKSIVNALAFLQSEKISHQGLLLENIYLNAHLNKVYLIDFVDEEKFENALNQAKKSKIFANLYTDLLNCRQEDNFFIDPYKSNVFALGLIILELGTSKLINFSKIKSNSKKEFEKKIEKKIRQFEEIYLHNLKNSMKSKIF